MKLTIIFLDGYKGWNVTKVKTKEVMDPFNETTCRDAFASVEGLDDEESSMSLKAMFGNKPRIKGNVLTCMGEEGGVVFVGE